MSLDGDQIRAEVEGMNELRDRIPVLTRVHVRYRLEIPAGTHDIVDRALERHVDKCPTAQSLKGAVTVTWEAEIREAGG